MLSVDQAIEAVLRHAQPLPARRTPLPWALGWTLAEDVAADIDLPPFDKALMDGYAVRSIDLAGPDSELLDSRALIYLRAGQAGAALRDVQQAIVQVAAPSKKLNFRLALVHLANNNRNGAIEAMAAAKALGLKATDLAIAEQVTFQKLVAELNLN